MKKFSLFLILSVLLMANSALAQTDSVVKDDRITDQEVKTGSNDGQPKTFVPKRSFLSSIQFWKPKPKAEDIIDYDIKRESDWHEDLTRYMNVREEEFYRFGYAQKGNQWYPIFFIRRFQMLRNQYEHTLIIRGQPAKMPRAKGMTLGRFGVEIDNDGFEYNMPTVASVSRAQKAFDDAHALDLARNRLESFGFEKIVWIEDRRRETTDIADTWRHPRNKNR